jgi:hypothetical protein
LRFARFSLIKASLVCLLFQFLQAHRFQETGYDLRATKEISASGLWIIGFEGEIGIGKSRLLAACIQEAEGRGLNIFSITMNMMLGSQG